MDGGKLTRNDYYCNVLNLEGSECLVCEYDKEGVFIQLTEILGPFNLDHATHTFTHDHSLLPTRRTIVTFQNGNQVQLDFDPVQDLERYRSRLTIHEADGSDAVTVYDDHLSRILKEVVQFATTGKMDDNVQRLASIGIAVKEVQKLLDLRESATLTDMSLVNGKVLV